LFSFFAFGYYFSFNYLQYEKQTINFNHTLADGKHKTSRGIVISDPENYRDKKGFVIIKLLGFEDNNSLKGTKIRVYYSSKHRPDFYRGDIVEFYAKFYPLKRKSNFYNSIFDYYYASVQISGSAYVKSVLLINKIETQNQVTNILSKYKTDFSQFLEDNLSDNNTSIINAMVTGKRKKIPEKTKYLWKESGIYHLLAISGAHVGILSFVLFYLLKFFRLKERKIYYFQIFFILIFLLFIGKNPPVFRASLMIILYFFAKLTWKDTDMINIVSLSGIIYLVIYPLSSLSIGFILTYFTTILLIFVFRRFSNVFFISTRVEQALYLVFFAFLISLPLNIYFFNYAPFSGLILNLLTFIIVPLILILSLFSLLFFKFIPAAAVIPVKASLFLISKLNLCAEYLGEKLLIRPVTPPLIIIFVYIAILLVFILVRKKRFLSFMFLVIVATAMVLFPERTVKNNAVYFLDVGHGNATYLETAPQTNILIDCGGSYKKNNFTGEYIISPFLFHKRIKTIEGIFITHFHPDHYYGCLRLIKNFNIKNIYLFNTDKELKPYKEIIKSIGDRKTKIIGLSYGDKITIGNIDFVILHPSKEIIKEVTNNDSMVIKTKFPKTIILFAGDIEKEAEEKILKRGENIRADILQVPHHGSKTSSTLPFLKKVNPEIAIISAGKSSVFNFPSKEVVKRLKKLKIKFYRTDLSGGIKLKIPR